MQGRISFFASLMKSVDSFPGMRSDEKIILVFRKHWIIHFMGILRPFVLMGLSLSLLFWISPFLWKEGDPAFFLGLSFACLLQSYILIWSLVLWMNDDLDVLIVTNERTVDITQLGFLRRNITEMGLEKIQDVSGETKGIIGNILNFGDISIRTASTYHNFCLRVIPDPHLSARNILECVDHIRKEEVIPVDPNTILNRANDIRHAIDETK